MRGLYVITPDDPSLKIRLAKTEAILRARAKLLQYRNKLADPETRMKEAQDILDLCRQYAVPMIVNDDIALASRTGADGVHLGKTDPSIATARECLGKRAIIGCSCYNDLGRASDAVSAGADYIAFGAFFSSPTKPNATYATPDIIHTAKQKFDIPIVAIGGVTPENGGVLVVAGAHMLAVISGLYASATPFHTAEKYVNLF